MPQEPRIDVETRAHGIESSLSAEQVERIAEALGHQGVWFAGPPERSGQTRPPEQVWELVGDSPHHGRLATGRAAVHLAEGHDALTRPLILADGFNYGPSDLDELWRHFNKPYAPGKPGFLDQLSTLGIDVILLGFDQRHIAVQANAAVAVTAVQRAIAERIGDAQLVVGGVSMGGLITRYALARMETERIDHQTEKYFSYDSPHLGAWIPLVLQQLAYLHEALDPRSDGPGQAELIRSPAAQQLLWGWVESADYSGPVTDNALRQEWIEDLRRVGWFPMRPYKLGMANATGNGVGNGLPAGTPVFDLNLDALQLVARFQPDLGELQNIGTVRFGAPVWTSATSHVPAFDGAPGGTLDAWGRLADAMGLTIEPRFRSSCFVPAVSAVALARDLYQWPSELHLDLSDLPKDETQLDAFCCDTTNTEHSAVSRPLIEWFLEQLAGW